MEMQGVQWLGRLSKEEQIVFCKNRVNHRDTGLDTYRGMTIAQYLLCEFDSFNKFIDGAFIWQNTPEGHDYWSDIANREVK
jgi:hypothetical protein